MKKAEICCRVVAGGISAETIKFHRSDAITSIAAFTGIIIALVGGKGYERADNWAALIAPILIIQVMRPYRDEISFNQWCGDLPIYALLRKQVHFNIHFRKHLGIS